MGHTFSRKKGQGENKGVDHVTWLLRKQNDEVLQSSTGVDMKLRTVQTGMSKAAVSMVSAMKGLVDYQTPLKRQPIGDIALDTKYHSGQHQLLPQTGQT